MKKILSFFLLLCLGNTFYVSAQCPAPVPFSISITSLGSSCQANGRILVSKIGGSAPFVYEIIAGPILAPPQTPNTFSALPPGNYIVQASDGCGTILTANAIVAGSYVTPDLTFVATEVTCSGLMDGSIEAFASDGLPAYEYRVIQLSSPPDTIGPQSSSLFTGLEKGNYQIQVFDQCDNFQTRSVTVDTVAYGPWDVYMIPPSKVGCDTFRASINVNGNPSPDLFPMEYVVYNNSNPMVVYKSGVAMSAPVIVDVDGQFQNYTFIATDNCGRTADIQFSTNHGLGSNLNYTCSDGLIFSMSPNKMLPPIIYEITAGPIVAGPQTSNVFPNLVPGTYTYQATDACGLTLTKQSTLNEPKWGINAVMLTNVTCGVGLGRIAFSLSTIGGHPKPNYPVTWTMTSAPSGVMVPHSFVAGASTANLYEYPPGDYEFTTTDACGTTYTAAKSLSGPLELNYSIDTEELCVNGNIVVNGGYNVTTNQYALYDLAGNEIAPFQNSGTFNNYPAAEYEVRIWNGASACLPILDTIELEPYQQPNLDLLAGIECIDGTAYISGFPEFGVEPYTFELISGPELRGPQSSPIFTGLPLGNYDVRMVDDCTNSYINSVDVEPFEPVISGYGPPFCIGDPLSLYVDNVNGATYSWTGPNGFASTEPTVDLPIVTPQDTGIYSVIITIPGCLTTTSIDLDVAVQGPCGVKVAIDVLLQGPYEVATGLMTDHLRASALLPILEPYTAIGYQQIGGGGETVDPLVFDVTGPDAIVDWILLELREASDNTTGIATRTGLLQADGDVVDLDGISPVLFDGVNAGDYFVVAKHRNHLDVMTPTALPLNEITAYPHDFRGGDAYGYPAYSETQKELTIGIFGLNEADYNQNGEINAGDRSIAWNFRNQTGYIVQDSNFDGECNAAERSTCWNNRNKLSQVP